jgi:signal transduction histidine kinase
VSVLAARGRHPDVLELEDWWRRRIDGRPVELLCGYALSGFSDAALVPVFRDVCSAHLDVEPAVAVADGGRRTVAELEQALQALATEHRRRKDVTEHLARLQRLTTVLAESAGASEIAQAVVDELQDVFNADVALYVVGDRGDELKLLAANRPRAGERIDDLTSPRGLAIGGVPLSARGRRLGVLRMVYRDGVTPGDIERALLDDYARQVALALERARAFDDAQLARRRLQVLADAARGIARARLDLGGVLATIATEVEQAGLAERCRVELDGPLPEAEGDHQLIVPLRSSGEVIGHIVASRAPASPAFSDEDRDILHELADRCALAVDNARLFQRARQEQQRAEEEQRRAEAANRAKDEFLAMLGHELRNPLSPILTAVQLMRLRAGDVLAKERTIIERQVSHMVRLVDDLLDVSRIVRGKVELRRVPLELAQVVASAIEIASPLLEERAHRLVTSVPSTGLLVEGDAARLAQVIGNLLTNAAKYTPNGGQIEVSASAGEGERVAVTVRDTGVGIEPALLPRVFENFVQGRQAIDRAGGGLGLGLAIARNLAEMHGGLLRAHSEGPGKGSTFTLELPLLGGGAAARRLTLPPLGVSPGGCGRRLLVVDDNRDGATMLAQALEAIGHTVRVAHDGPAGAGGGGDLPARAGAARHRPAGDGRLRAGPAPARQPR